MAKQRVIELLAPAKDAQTAFEAILHGADAVYMGAPKFGARAAAGNTLYDIARVVDFAHTYHVRVYVALNVLLHDNELSEVESLIHELWSIGVDALIVQDMGITRLNLPPIPLHASTQTNNRTPAKVRFLEQAGFQQVVLARELSLEQIREISAQTSVKLEVFVHGALCVSYSGQCYLSHAMSGRSANRGECAQWCRLPYNLYDKEGQLMIRQKHLLSLKDLNLSEYLDSLIDIGVSSFKIEGRLKDSSYVKNVTSWYHERLNDILSNRRDVVRASIGESRIGFIPDPVKSFNRGFTSYFMRQRVSMCNLDTPKSIGEPIGYVKRLNREGLTIEGNVPLSNGDGVGYLDSRGLFQGFRINRVEGSVLISAGKQVVSVGTRLFRTYDQAFERQLEKEQARRILPVKVTCWETNAGFAVEMADDYGHRVVRQVLQVKTAASQPQQERVAAIFFKTGHTRFEVRDCVIRWSSEWFVPVSVWTSVKRELCMALERVIRLSFKRDSVRLVPTFHEYPEPVLDYTGQVLNEASKAFFKEHGVRQTEWAPEHPFSSRYASETTVMFNKYCLKFELGLCPKHTTNKQTSVGLRGEPSYLLYQKKRIDIHFDCKRCEMNLTIAPTDN